MNEMYFDNFAAIEGIAYTAPPDIDVSSARAHRVKPEIERYEIDGQEETWVLWPSARGGYSTASPVRTWETEPIVGETSAQTALRSICERLELPGSMADYHFELEAGIQTLLHRKRAAPWLFLKVEELCWLTIRL